MFAPGNPKRAALWHTPVPTARVTHWQALTGSTWRLSQSVMTVNTAIDARFLLTTIVEDVEACMDAHRKSSHRVIPEA